MRILLAVLATAAGLLLFASVASSQSPYQPGTVGHDVSFPQCEATLPAAGTYAFGIVGITGGFAFTENGCLEEQYTWASAASQPPSLYINTKFPAGTTIDERDTGPAGTCTATDTECQAYNYGYKTAQHAVTYAKTQGVTQVTTWWLDVETENTWSDDKEMNAVVIEAAIDYLEDENLPVGIYSTAYQWQEIAGDFAPGLPNWLGGASDLEDAKALCATGAFGGGIVELVQFPGSVGSNDYVCTEDDRTNPPPTSGSDLITGGEVPIEGGFGLAVFAGGTADDLVQATACPIETAAYYFTVDGAFVIYIPGTEVEAVNAAFLAAFPSGTLPDGTAFLGKCV